MLPRSRRLGGFRQWLLGALLAATVPLPAAAVQIPPARKPPSEPYVVVLGIAQDGGYPQAGCNRPHCRPGWEDPARRRSVASLGVVDPASGQRWMVDATPDFPRQLRRLDDVAPPSASPGLDGVLLTHAHVGHYAGLIHLGREVIGAREVPVFAMPRMRAFLAANEPWAQLVRLGNVALRPLADGEPVVLNERVRVTPLRVPHRDELSETVAFLIAGPGREVLYLPDIDKWERWDASIEELLARVDVAYLDGTFFDGDELPGRSMAEIPHPFVSESLHRFGALPAEVRGRVRFLHLNHSNPALETTSAAARAIRDGGMRIAEEGEIVSLGQPSRPVADRR